jgi:hypothetical protein
MTLPKHLSMYVGEQGVISQGYVWTHRVDRRAARTDTSGVKRTPVRLVNLGPVDALNPSYQRENNRPGQQAAKGAKTPDFVLDSKASRSDDHLLETEGLWHPLEVGPERMGMMI